MQCQYGLWFCFRIRTFLLSPASHPHINIHGPGGLKPSKPLPFRICGLAETDFHPHHFVFALRSLVSEWPCSCESLGDEFLSKHPKPSNNGSNGKSVRNCQSHLHCMAGSEHREAAATWTVRSSLVTAWFSVSDVAGQ